jgi:hypothetical protein
LVDAADVHVGTLRRVACLCTPVDAQLVDVARYLEERVLEFFFKLAGALERPLHTLYEIVCHLSLPSVGTGQDLRMLNHSPLSRRAKARTLELLGWVAGAAACAIAGLVGAVEAV